MKYYGPIYFYALAIVSAILVLLTYNKTYNITVHDTYFVLSYYFHFAIIAVASLFTGLFYAFMGKIKKPISNKVALFHFILVVVGLFFTLTIYRLYYIMWSASPNGSDVYALSAVGGAWVLIGPVCLVAGFLTFVYGIFSTVRIPSNYTITTYTYTESPLLQRARQLPPNNVDLQYNKLQQRRNFFEVHFPPVKVGLRSQHFLTNTCPICGYLTIDERIAHQICFICFWEDDGVDEHDTDEESGPNNMSLNEGRQIFYYVKNQLQLSDDSNPLIASLKNMFTKLDTYIEQDIPNTNEIKNLLQQIENLLTENKIYGLEKLFDTTIQNS